MSGAFGRNVNSDVQKIEILGALAISVGILGDPYFRNFGSPKIRKNGSAPNLLPPDERAGTLTKQPIQPAYSNLRAKFIKLEDKSNK